MLVHPLFESFRSAFISLWKTGEESTWYVHRVPKCTCQTIPFYTCTYRASVRWNYPEWDVRVHPGLDKGGKERNPQFSTHASDFPFTASHFDADFWWKILSANFRRRMVHYRVLVPFFLATRFPLTILYECRFMFFVQTDFSLYLSFLFSEQLTICVWVFNHRRVSLSKMRGCRESLAIFDETFKWYFSGAWKMFAFTVSLRFTMLFMPIKTPWHYDGLFWSN